MLKDVRLYIAGKLVDCSEKLSLPITYQTEDFKNPTIVKNSFSKTITIPATANNNKIFGEIYKLDRLQHYENNSVGINYNPSKRVDFQLFKDAELVESGYVQLNSVSTLNGDVKYNITLFGGLGDFFYGLKYNEDGSERTLADLQFFVNDENGNVLPKDDEFNFQINKEFVNKCFNKDWSTDNNRLEDFITFVPAYNGLYENFDTSHCLINSVLNFRFPTSVEDQDVTYTTYNGYALASLNSDYTEWQMRDLRSYQQRPAIKVSKLIETICRSENSGYDVVFDPNFFNSNNPYWNDSFIMLPLLGSDENEEIESLSSKISTSGDLIVGTYNGSHIKKDSEVYTTDSVFEVSDGVIDISNAPELSTINIYADVKLKLTPQNTSVDNWYPAAYIAGFPPTNKGGSFTAQLLLYDENDNIIGSSALYNFTMNCRDMLGNDVTPQPSDWINFTPTVSDYNLSDVYGNFVKYSDGNYYFKGFSGSDTFRLSINNWARTTDKIKIKLEMTNQTVEVNQYRLYANSAYTPFDTPVTTRGYVQPILNTESSIFSADWESKMISNFPITKKILLKTENSPADFLLSYSKLFGLYFVKDIEAKTIRIYNRNGFFKKEIVNIEDRIDHSKDITINPILFDKKWYRMSLETPETYFAKKYNKQYDLVYGQKRLDTGYNFNSEIAELYDSNVFENIITAIDSDKYFRRFYNNSLLEMPCWLNDNATYTLYNQTDTELNEHTLDLYGANFINPYATREWNYKSGLDIYPKPCLFSLDGEEKSLEEISSALVFYNGRKELRDYTGSTIDFWLTDDLPEMLTLNDEACYINTNTETDINGDTIAINITSLPSYTSYKSQNGTIIASFDLGLPKEFYVDRLAYNEDATIYNKFWDSFYKDQFDINTKKVTCFVKLDYANQEMLRKFYWFDNSIWILNKIDSFDINSNNTVRCEFIKVQDMNNYTTGVQDYR